jgi:hypothetical protein
MSPGDPGVDVPPLFVLFQLLHLLYAGKIRDGSNVWMALNSANR